jgi:hypothetical protein
MPLLVSLTNDHEKRLDGRLELALRRTVQLIYAHRNYQTVRLQT